MTVWRRVSCLISKAAQAQAHTPALAHLHTLERTYARRHTHNTRAHTHTHTHTHTEICNTNCFSTATMVSRTRLSVTLHVHCLSCWSLKRRVFGQTDNYQLFKMDFSALICCCCSCCRCCRFWQPS